MSNTNNANSMKEKITAALSAPKTTPLLSDDANWESFSTTNHDNIYRGLKRDAVYARFENHADPKKIKEKGRLTFYIGNEVAALYGWKKADQMVMMRHRSNPDLVMICKAVDIDVHAKSYRLSHPMQANAFHMGLTMDLQPNDNFTPKFTIQVEFEIQNDKRLILSLDALRAKAPTKKVRSLTDWMPASL